MQMPVPSRMKIKMKAGLAIPGILLLALSVWIFTTHHVGCGWSFLAGFSCLRLACSEA